MSKHPSSADFLINQNKIQSTTNHEDMSINELSRQCRQGVYEGEAFFAKTISRCRHTDWDLCEMVRIQELNETRQRASQMENTMRWWLSASESWREKWNTVRNERNRARDETIRLRNALAKAKTEIRELTAAKDRSDALARQLVQKLAECNATSMTVTAPGDKSSQCSAIIPLFATTESSQQQMDSLSSISSSTNSEVGTSSQISKSNDSAEGCDNNYIFLQQAAKTENALNLKIFRDM